MTLNVDNLTTLHNTQPTEDILSQLQQLTEEGLGNHYQQRYGYYHIQVIDSGLNVIQLVCEDDITDEKNFFLCYVNGREMSSTEPSLMDEMFGGNPVDSIPTI